MKWFIMVFLCILCWSAGDLCYKKGSEGEDTTTPLQFLVWLGIVMGVAMFFLLPYSEKQLPLLQLTMSYIDYAPFAVAYVAALLVGLMGILDASVLSPPPGKYRRGHIRHPAADHFCSHRRYQGSA